MTLETLVAAELAVPVEPRVGEAAATLAGKYGEAARAVLFYGSCLRTAELDGQMLDFYLIVSDYRAAYGKSWLATANRLLPPNVFPFEHRGLAAKYAVLSEADFRRECGREASTVSVWARFAQPSRLVWSADEAARVKVVEAVSRAAPTLLEAAVPLFRPGPSASLDSIDLWRFAFSLTYGAELRAERANRPGSVVDADPERYGRFTAPALAAIDRSLRPDAARRRWAQLRRKGKLLTAARLSKAAFTFAGGIDYLAWKINRHAGTRIAIKPWQRRHPFLAALTLLPRLLGSGAVR